MPQQLVVIAGPDQGRSFPLAAGGKLVLGRGRTSDTRLTDPQVSRTHCEIHCEPHQVVVTDSGSIGGTQVNGQPLAGRQVLRPGDVLHIGQTELRLESASVPAPARPSFDDLLGRLRAGDETAANQIYQRYAQRLIALAQARLGEAIGRKVDPEEVVQSVYKSFFVRFADGEFQVANWESLWGLLTGITLRKCGRKFEHFRAGKRDVAKEVRVRLSPKESAAGWEAIARDPTPSEAAVLAETVEQLMRALKNPQQREIVALGLQGYTAAEIAQQLGCSDRTVQRVLRGVKEWLEKRQRNEP